MQESIECKQKTKREKMREQKKIYERKTLCKVELLSYIHQKVRRPEIKKRR